MNSLVQSLLETQEPWNRCERGADELKVKTENDYWTCGEINRFIG